MMPRLSDMCKKNNNHRIAQYHLLSFYFTTQLVEYKVERLEFYEKMLSNTWDPFISIDY